RARPTMHPCRMRAWRHCSGGWPLHCFRWNGCWPRGCPMPAEPRTPAQVIAQIASRWRLERLALWALATALLGGAAWLLGATLPATLAVAACPAIAGAYLDRRRPITALTVAQHLDRVAPVLEESTTLL